MSSEIVMGSESGCPIEVHQIEIEKCDEMYDHECEGGKSIPFHRAGYDRNTGQSPNTPRQQVRQPRVCFNNIYQIYDTLNFDIILPYIFLDKPSDQLD